MGNNLLMRMKDRFVGTLAVYAQAESTLGFEVDKARAAKEISKQIVTSYMSLVQMKNVEPFVLEASNEIAMVVAAAADLDKDPWDVCREEGVRIRTAYGFARIIEKKAGDRHKFSVWSGISYGSKTSYGKGVRVIVAAPSAKKAVGWLNQVLGGNENLSNFRDHWSGGGTIGESLATKQGIWVAKKKESSYHEERDFKLVWEPKS